MYYNTFTIAHLKLTVFASPNGIERIEINSNPEIPAGYKKAPVSSAVFFGLHDQLKEYFAGERKTFSVPLSITGGTTFQKKVWKQLQRIPYGKTISYKQLAKAAGSEKAFRAVGNANGKNPIPIIIPCHRVINADGSLGGFSCGIEVKKQLLAVEK